MLLSPDEREAVFAMRRNLSAGNPAEVTEQLISMLEKTATNEEFVARLKGWMNVYEKDGYTTGKSFMK